MNEAWGSFSVHFGKQIWGRNVFYSKVSKFWMRREDFQRELTKILCPISICLLTCMC